MAEPKKTTIKEVGKAVDDFTATAPLMWKILKVMAFVVVCLIVAIVLLEIQLARRNKDIDAITNAVVRIEAASEEAKKASTEAKQAAADSKAASEKASADLAAALERASSPSPRTERVFSQVDELYEIIAGRPYQETP